MSDDVSEYTRGYIDGKAAGRMMALREISDRVPRAPIQPRKRPALPAERRCECGHADVTHNELGYCQGKQKYDDPAMRKYADQCECDSFINSHQRLTVAEYLARTTASALPSSGNAPHE